MTNFVFQNPGTLRDAELELRVVAEQPANPAKGYVPAYEFGLFVGGQQVGRLNFRAVNTPLLSQVGGHLGYAVDATHRGHGYAARACKLILPFARQHGFTELVITCNPDNVASYLTCERLGAAYTGLVAVPPDHAMYARGETQKRRYVLKLT